MSRSEKFGAAALLVVAIAASWLRLGPARARCPPSATDPVAARDLPHHGAEVRDRFLKRLATFPVYTEAEVHGFAKVYFDPKTTRDRLHGVRRWIGCAPSRFQSSLPAPLTLRPPSSGQPSRRIASLELAVICVQSVAAHYNFRYHSEDCSCVLAREYGRLRDADQVSRYRGGGRDSGYEL